MVFITLILALTASAVTPIKVGSSRLYVLGLFFSVCLLSFNINIELFNSYLILSKYRSVLIMLVLIVALFSETGPLVLLSVLGTSLLVLSNHFTTIIIAIELQSFTLYGLTYLSNGRVSEEASGSSFKYLLLGALASSFLMLSVAINYVITGVLDLNTSLQLSIPLISTVLILAGLFFKLGVAPFHQWVADVYGNLQTKTIAYVSLAPKVGVLALILSLNNINQSLVVTSAFLTMIVGSVGGLMQTEYRRLLAYSSISHMGYLLLASTVCSPSVLLVYLIQYVVTTLSVLYLFDLMDTDKTGKLSCVSNAEPYAAAMLGLFLFSLAGVPPLVGFFAKLEVFYGLASNQINTLLVVAIITSVIGAYYYLRVIMLMFPFSSFSNSNPNLSWVLVSASLSVVLVCLEGELLLQWAQLMAWPYALLC